MITFLSSSGGVVGCRYYLEKRGRSLAQRIRPVPYCELADLNSIPAGASIFAAIDQLLPMQREAVTEAWDQLSEAGQRLLNHPTRSLRRYELLRRLYESGRNRFQVFRGDESCEVERFPVFVRQANKHTGSLTPLLDSRVALERALAWLIARGFHTANLLIVEYCDTRDSAGLVRKYAAFKVGEVILAKHLLIGSDWMLKDHSRLPDCHLDEEKVQEGQEYIQTNPHEAWIREIFEIAQIDYGRIDYGFCENTPQVWEVNTDPTIGGPSRPRTPERERYRSMRKTGQDCFHQRFRAALRNLDGLGHVVPEIPVLLVPELRRKLRAEFRRDQITHTVAGCVSRFVHLPAIQQLMPLLERAAAAIAPLVSRIPRLREE